MLNGWTCHWQQRLWHPDINTEYDPIDGLGNDTFKKRRVSIDDVLYIVTIIGGQLYLGGRMRIKQLVTRRKAIQLLGTDNLYEANQWAVNVEEKGTPLHLHRRLHPTLTRKLRRYDPKGAEKSLCFDTPTDLNGQATRTILKLTAESVALLDSIIEATDSMRPSKVLTVTEKMLQ